jgi:hypothetical protein
LIKESLLVLILNQLSNNCRILVFTLLFLKTIKSLV